MSTLKVNTLEEATSGGATYFTAKAWVNFNGTGTVAIRDDGNFSSIYDNGTGDYTLSFSSSISDTDYITILGSSVGAATGWSTDGLCVRGSAVSSGGNGLPTLKSTSQLRIASGHMGNTVRYDMSLEELAIFR